MRHAEAVNSKAATETAKWRQVEDELREASQTLQAIIDASPLAVMAVDHEGRVTNWSSSAERVFGWSRDEAVGQPNPIVPEGNWAEYRALLARVLSGARFSGSETRRRKKNGALIDVSISAAPLRNSAGEVVGVMGVIEDISERKHAEQERDRLLSQLRAIINHIDTGLIISDVQGQILEMNPAARDLCGYTTQRQVQRHSLESRILFDLKLPDGAPLALENWPRMRTLRGETFSNWELRVRRREDGTEAIISFGGTPVRDKDGQVVFTLVTLRDVTERWKAQAVLEGKVRERTAELDRFNKTLQAIIDCNQAIIRADSEQELLQEFCRISMDVEGIDLAWVGLAEQDERKSVRLAASVGFHARDLSHVRISWADDAFGQGPASLAIRTGQICIKPNLLTDPSLVVQREEDLNLGFGSSVALPLQFGSRIIGALVLNTAEPEIFDENQIRMFRELANNLSIGLNGLRTQAERDRALQTAESRAEQLRAMSLELAQIEQRERRRLAQILHDNLQQLLVGATFHVKVLKGRRGSKPIQKTLDQLSETITEALEVSRAMTTELSPPIFYEKGLSDGLEWLATQMQRKHGLRVSIETLGNIEPKAEQIRMFLFEAVRELLLNIVKHAQVDHARVRVRPLESEEIEVTVADGGLGFDATRLEGGGGFGLFNIREKLKSLQGRMKIESDPGRGSRFTLVVPTRGWRENRNQRRPLMEVSHADQNPDSR